jgi:hypothetical protein
LVALFVNFLEDDVRQHNVAATSPLVDGSIPSRPI